LMLFMNIIDLKLLLCNVELIVYLETDWVVSIYQLKVNK
jgi:hypothetical protein